MTTADLSPNICPLIPLWDSVIILRDKPPDRLDSTHIIVIGKAQQEPKTRIGTVFGVGPGKWNKELKKYVDPEVSVGDRVVYGKYVGMNPKVHGKEFLLLHESEVLGIASQEVTHVS